VVLCGDSGNNVMNVIHRRGWEIPDRLATPEHFVFNRRSFVAAGVSALTLSPLGATAQRLSDVAKLPDPSADLYPAKRNEKVNGNYNNFYEFGTSKSIAAAAQALPIRPWTVKIDGMVEKPMEVGIDDMIRKLTLEERTYRHRCVEAWGMAIAWTGFPFAKLVEFARPLGSAQYVRMETFTDPKVAPSAAAVVSLVSVALCRRCHDGGSDQRTRPSCDRCLRASACAATWCAIATGPAVEIWLQVHQVDRALQLH
jgi:DMSO/TMAO reductase YedYZ molybdopterin-dependent catalytic subunit